MLAQVLRVAGSPSARPEVGRPRWSRVVDAVIAGAVTAFALWTLLYEAALGLKWPVTPITVVWLVVVVPVGSLVGRASYREERLDDEARPAPAGGDALLRHRTRRTMVRGWVAGALAVCSAGLLALGSGATFWVGWVLAICSLALIAVGLVGPARRREVDESGAVAGHGRFSVRGGDSIVFLTSCAVSVGSLFVYRRSGDDAYYVNLSTWVVAHDHFPLRDTMFSDEVFPSFYGGGFPITSIEGLIGALARLVHLSAGTMAYLVVAPVLAFASIWVLGQLARLWIPARVLPVFMVSLFFVLVGGSGSYRSYSLYRIWEGKAAAIAIVLPLVWIYATRMSRSPRRHWALMMCVLGVSFVGLTPTSAILSPAIASALILAAVVLRHRMLVGAAVAFVIPPLLGGLAVVMLNDTIGGPNPTAPTPWNALHSAYGTKSTMVILTVVAAMLAPLLLRGIRVGALAWSAAVVPILLLAPGVLEIGNLMTSSGPIEWRMLVVPPVPTLVGVLVVASIGWTTGHLFAADHPQARAAVGSVLAAVALTGLAVAGDVPWQAADQVSRTPAWKTYQQPLANVKALVATNPPRGQLILMPENEMTDLSIYTVDWHGVAPRRFDISGLAESPAWESARYTLTQLASGYPRNLSPREVKNALELLNVGTVCLTTSNHGGQASVRAAGFSAFEPVGTLRCTTRKPPAAP